MKSRSGPGNLGCLPADVLCQIVKQLNFDDKLHLELVSRKLHALLLRPPSGEDLWGECNLSAVVDGCLGKSGYTDPMLRRWLVKRVPYMTRIICDTRSANGAQMLHTLVPSLSGLMAPAAQLCIKLDTRHTEELLQCKAGEQPHAAVLDFWRILSARITDLTINVNQKQQQMLSQPQLLSELSALTALTFTVTRSEQEGGVGDILNLPELRTLRIQGYDNRDITLECPKLTSLTLASCIPLGYVSLQAPLQELFATSSCDFKMHAEFPLTNFIDLVSLDLQCDPDHEWEFMKVLPQMKKLRNLELDIWKANSFLSFPQSLCAVELRIICGGAWDNSIIPLLQELPKLTELSIELEYDPTDPSGANLSADLKPFMAMQKLRNFQLGHWEAWSPSTFKALGELEAELVSSGSKLQLLY